MWYFPPTRRSIEHTVILSSNGANQLHTCSGFVSTSKTSSIGASNSRVVRISRALGNSMTADPCRLGVIAVSLSLQLGEVVVHPVEPVIHRLLVLGHPVVQRPEPRGLQPVDPVTAVRPAGDQSHLGQHP